MNWQILGCEKPGPLIVGDFLTAPGGGEAAKNIVNESLANNGQPDNKGQKYRPIEKNVELKRGGPTNVPETVFRLYVLGSKLLVLGMVIPPPLGNTYNG